MSLGGLGYCPPAEVFPCCLLQPSCNTFKCFYCSCGFTLFPYRKTTALPWWSWSWVSSRYSYKDMHGGIINVHDKLLDSSRVETLRFG